MIVVFYILAAMLVYSSYRSFRDGSDYLGYFRHENAMPLGGFAPFASVFAPCKGLDEGLTENLSALLVQDYPAYEVVFVVDDYSDPAVSVIRKIAPDAKLVVAPVAAKSSQKIENLREAVLHASPAAEVFAFVDSDVRTSPEWLRRLVAPLADDSVGTATGYRWFISPRRNFAAALRSVWNASIASSLGPGANNQFCWGGSMAVLRRTFDRLDIRERWNGTVSDDFVLSQAARAAGLSIYFVPQALSVSSGSCTLGEMFEFTTRQMKLTRVYAPKLWKLSLAGSGLFNLVIISALIIAVFSENRLNRPAAIFTLAVVSVFSAGKALLRLRAVDLVLDGSGRIVREQALSHLTLWAVTPALFFCNCVLALASRRIRWRGIEYILISASETIRIADADETASGRHKPAQK